MENPKEHFLRYPDEFIAVKEASGLLRVGEGTVRRWVRLGLLTAVRVGRTIWIHRLSLNKFIK